MKKFCLLTALSLLLSVAFATSATTTRSKMPVVIGSANFAESELLAEIFA